MEIVSNNRTPVTLLCGFDRGAVGRVADACAAPGTVLVHHDLRLLGAGIVIATVRSVGPDGVESYRVTRVELDHGCVSCTLRGHLLPLLRALHRREQVARIVLILDPALEPAEVSAAIDEVVVTGMPGFVDGPAGRDVRVDSTLACIREEDWLESATGDLTLAESGVLAGLEDWDPDGNPFGDAVGEGQSDWETTPDLDDDRTLAQVAVGQVAFADALVVAAADPAVRDHWQSARTMAVLSRLAPGAPIMIELPQRPMTAPRISALLAAIGPDARRGRPDDRHGSLLARQPELGADCGVELVEFHADRPFHPQRLHAALDELLEGVVRARGRVWLATRPDRMMWLESAGGALRIDVDDRWVAAMSDDDIARLPTDRQVMAALRWDPGHGDRHSALVVLVDRADPTHIQQVLRDACLDDTELAAGADRWARYPDPFGEFHRDPCTDLEPDAPGDGGIGRDTQSDIGLRGKEQP
ncbi:GTP-binding protein [Gordonia sp. ABSL1-1]|uniref:GTP-binding protein n=1 Tax=Gordonia sp. ABSL1-1 TaxID=3053923 RepID=UPI0025740B79|nr:GTP-binding protein [Gordonia sp. ABSL1-1]MDL9938261.1 GTP-binding protein [Gordonia sp. ABSL1-1]